ncbi:hypothetical protein ACE5IS_19890, partial [Leptospira wolffii]
QSYIYAIFWQDFDIPSEYSTAAVNRILDGLFKPEYIAVLEDKWSLWVYKDEKRIKVHSDLTYAKAMEMLKESGGFKAEKQVFSKFRKGNPPIGMQSADGSTGFRVEYDERSKGHINTWSKKGPKEHFQFEGSEKTVEKITKQFMCK